MQTWWKYSEVFFIQLPGDADSTDSTNDGDDWMYFSLKYKRGQIREWMHNMFTLYIPLKTFEKKETTTIKYEYKIK